MGHFCGLSQRPRCLPMSRVRGGGQSDPSDDQRVTAWITLHIFLQATSCCSPCGCAWLASPIFIRAMATDGGHFPGRQRGTRSGPVLPLHTTSSYSPRGWRRLASPTFFRAVTKKGSMATWIVLDALSTLHHPFLNPSSQRLSKERCSGTEAATDQHWPAVHADTPSICPASPNHDAFQPCAPPTCRSAG